MFNKLVLNVDPNVPTPIWAAARVASPFLTIKNRSVQVSDDAPVLALNSFGRLQKPNRVAANIDLVGFKVASLIPKP